MTSHYEENQKAKYATLEKLKALFEFDGFTCEIHHENGMAVIINKLQEIYVRPFDNKAYASLCYNSKALQCIYVNDEMRRLEIGFKKDKTAEALHKDITKRLINSEWRQEQRKYLEERVSEHNTYMDKKSANLKAIEDITGMDLSGKDADGFSLYGIKDGYGKVTVYADSISIEARSLPVDVALKIVKVLYDK